MIGKPNDKYLIAILETLPVEFSVIDNDDNILACNNPAFKKAKNHAVISNATPPKLEVLAIRGRKSYKSEHH
jgi:hypothetical protein